PTTTAALFPYTTLFRSVVEMTAQAQIIGGSTFRLFETYLALALIYWPICIVLEILIRKIESKLEIKMPKAARKISLGRNPFDNGDRKSTRLNSSHVSIS